MKYFKYSMAILLISADVLCASGFNLGMTGAVKNKVKELDEKVAAYKVSHPSSSSLTLKGTFAASSSAGKMAPGQTINRVALVTPYAFRLENIGSTGFSVDVGVERGQPLGMVFINTSGAIAGCLQTIVNSTDTLSLLPLTKIKDGTTEIDLQTISFGTDAYGKIAVPTYDPVGPGLEIPLSATEKKSAAKMSKILANILKNADVNGNGVVDFLEGHYFRFCIQYGISAGQLPAGSPDGQYDATVFTTSTLGGFFTRCLDYPNNINWHNSFPITFPAGYSGSHGTKTGSNDLTQNSSGPAGGTEFPIDGLYYVDAASIGSGTLTFNVYGQADAVENIIIPFPTYHISGGKLTSVTWTWKLRNDITGANIDPEAFISNLLIQVSKTSVSSPPQLMYDTDGDTPTAYPWAGVRLTGAEGTHTIGVNSLLWPTDCGRITFAYDDKYGNHVVVQFER